MVYNQWLRDYHLQQQIFIFLWYASKNIQLRKAEIADSYGYICSSNSLSGIMNEAHILGVINTRVPSI